MAGLLIRDALVVSGGAEMPYRGWVRIDGNRIAATGSGAPEAGAARVIEARGGALVPGLVNTHAHSHSSLTRGSAEGMALEAWIQAIIREQRQLTPEQAYIGALATYSEALLSGTTTILDMCLFPEEALRAAQEIGIRAVIAPYVADSMSFTPTLERTATLLASASDERLRVWVGLHDLESCSDTQIRAGIELALDRHVGLHLHCAESRFWTERTRSRTGRSPFEHLEHLGAFATRVHLAHCVWAAEADRRLLARYRATVAHCPHANLKLGSGVAPVPEMRAAGVHVALATDGAKANNRLDMFDVMKFASLLHKGVTHNPATLTSVEVLDMATNEGAAALDLNGGRIAAGALADLTLVAVDRFHLQPAEPETIVTNLVHAARGSDVDTVIVDGRVVVERGRLTSLDQDELLRRHAAVGRALLQ
jgi:5-methylthioadenosine/S-adenosylhomocysteine deaminase